MHGVQIESESSRHKRVPSDRRCDQIVASFSCASLPRCLFFQSNGPWLLLLLVLHTEIETLHAKPSLTQKGPDIHSALVKTIFLFSFLFSL